MTFRSLALIALYTLLIGPVLDVPSSNAKAKARAHAVRVVANR
jgi:hypothetical protein